MPFVVLPQQGGRSGCASTAARVAVAVTAAAAAAAAAAAEAAAAVTAVAVGVAVNRLHHGSVAGAAAQRAVAAAAVVAVTAVTLPRAAGIAMPSSRGGGRTLRYGGRRARVEVPPFTKVKSRGSRGTLATQERRRRAAATACSAGWAAVASWRVVRRVPLRVW